jgi:hypothetical protein
MDDPGQARFGQEMYGNAKKICQGCDHLIECAEWAIRYEDHGVWGGTTPADRKNIRRKLKIDRRVTQLPFWVK